MQTLRLFCDVARLRSFSKAAGRHGITQSAASQRIGHLEQRLQVTLLDRSVRPLGLTDAGRLLLHEGAELVERYDHLEQRIAQLHGGPEGQVSVSAIYSAGIGLLNQIKDAFEQAYPRIRVSLEYRTPQEVHDAVVQQRSELGIVSYPQRWKDVEQMPLRDEVMAVVCAPTHPLAQRQSVTAHELTNYDMATFDQDLPVARRLHQYLKENHARPHIAQEFDNIDTIRGVVEVTDLFAILPKRTVLREVAAGRLAVVELSPELVRPIGVIYRKRKRSGTRPRVDHPTGRPEPFAPAARLFVDFLLTHAGSAVPSLDAVESRGREMVGGRV